MTREQFFGANTLDGGADKAAHFADYFVLSKEFASIFGKLGFSESAALLMGLGTAMVGGALNEVGDGRPHVASGRVSSRRLLGGSEAQRAGPPARAQHRPLRYFLFSVTYGTKGYPDGPVAERQRQVGLEIGLNLEQILSDLGVTRDTWWGYALHLAGDNVRWPFTAIGFRYDPNHGKWHGPNGGNWP